MAYISQHSMINDGSNMDVGTMTMIDVTFPVLLLIHSEMDLVERMTNCVSFFFFSLPATFSPSPSISSLPISFFFTLANFTYS